LSYLLVYCVAAKESATQAKFNHSKPTHNGCVSQKQLVTRQAVFASLLNLTPINKSLFQSNPASIRISAADSKRYRKASSQFPTEKNKCLKK